MGIRQYFQNKYGAGYRRANTASPQRKREGLKTAGHPHNSNPYGGKTLRKGRYRLLTRIEGNNSVNTKRPDRIRSNDEMTPWGDYGFTKPGSMR